MPNNRRSKYLGLSLLLPTVGARYLLHLHPDLVGSLLKAVASTNLANGASQLLIRLLDAHGKEMQEEGHKGKVGYIAQQLFHSGRATDPS